MTHKRRDRRPRWLQTLDALHRIERLLEQQMRGQFNLARRLARIEHTLNLTILNDHDNTEAVMADPTEPHTDTDDPGDIDDTPAGPTDPGEIPGGNVEPTPEPEPAPEP